MNKSLILKIEKEISNGYISKQKHPEENLFILNYTKKCQYDWHWTEATIMCRGLIVDGNYNIIQRPFKKFFTFDQYKDLQNKNEQLTKRLYNINVLNILNEPGILSVKYDGALGILYWIKDKPFITTRGLFESEQSLLGTKIIQNDYKYVYEKINKQYTYLFEICSPNHKIVVDYDHNFLEPIAVINKNTGKDEPDEFLSFFNDVYFCTFRDNNYNNLKNILESKQSQSIEGYVLHYPQYNDFRIKFKFDWYLEMHKLLMNLTPRYIFEMFCDDTWRNKIEQLPDELQPDVKKQIVNYQEQYHLIEIEAKRYFNKYKSYANIDRGHFATTIAQMVPSIYHPILFNMLDGKEYNNYIYKLIKNKV